MREIQPKDRKMNAQTQKELPNAPDSAWWLAPYLEFGTREIFGSRKKHIRKTGIKEGDTVLEVGCGTGFFTVEISKLVGPTGRVYAVDVQPQMIKKIERRIKSQQLTNVVPILTGSTKIPLDANSVDVIYAANVFEEIEIEGLTEATLTELDRLCRRGGFIFIHDHKLSRRRHMFEKVKKILAQKEFSVTQDTDSLVSRFIKLQKQ